MSEWIKCSDRLPDDSFDGRAVIVAALSRGELIAETDVWSKPAAGRGGYFEFWTNTATHWMPLPTPPTD